MKAFLIFIFLKALLINGDFLLPTDNYINSLILQGPDLFKLFWNYTDTDIIGEIHVKNNGWVLFGFSAKEEINNADAIVSWIEPNGSYHFTDRHIVNYNAFVDKVQNWFPLGVEQFGSYLIVKFTRKLKICDPDKEDFDIVDGTPRVLMAYGSGTFNDNLQINNFNQYFRSITLINTINKRIDYTDEELEYADFTVNHTVYSGFQTTYHCQVFKLPENWYKSKYHIVKIDTILTPGNEKYIHHWILTECSKKYESYYLKTRGEPTPGLCNYNNESQPASDMLEVADLCYKISMVWQIGGKYTIEYPPDKGYPVGGPDEEFKYFMIEVHYNNDQYLNDIKDYSGVRIYATKKLRPIEFGMFTVGAVFEWNTILIPPGQERFEANYYFRKDCVEQIENGPENKNAEVKIFSSLFHTHNIGKEAYAKIIRDGKEVDYFYNNKYYDGSIQDYQYLNKPVTLKKGDELKLTCRYNSMKKNTYTKGGLGASEEMCQMFVLYYPRNPSFVRCKEQFSYDTWRAFLKQLNQSGDIKYTSSQIEGSNIPKDLLDAQMTPSLIKKIQDFHNLSYRTQIIYDIDIFNFAFYEKKNQIFSFNNPPLQSIPIDDQTCIGSANTTTPNSNDQNTKDFIQKLLDFLKEKLNFLFNVF